MDFYPAELATPPLALVALLGCPDLHAIVGEFLRAAHKPPINSLGIAEPTMAARLFGAKKAFITAPSGPLNILKADWFAKHRQQRPAVAAIFFERSAVLGDPNQWSKVLAGLEAVRQATRPRGAKTVVVIVHPPDVPAVEVPEDKLAGIIRQSGTERKWVISINTADGELALKRLGRTLYEAACMFYLDDACRRLAVHQERRNPAPQTSSKVAFKVAALAEFRADWATAVKTYQAAYLELLRIPQVGQLPLQRWTELTSVAEVMHLKAVTLLLHQANVPEALKQFQQHMGAFKRMPLPPPPAAASAHGAWLVRQYTVMAELLSSRVEAGLLPQQREAQPAHFYLGAAHAAIDRRRAAQRAAELRPPGATTGVNVAPGSYIGQLVSSDAQSPRHLTDEEFLHHLEAGEASAAPTLAAAALDKLKQAHELIMRARDARQTRLAYQLGALMAREQLVAQDPASARRLLQSVAGIYRREGWEVPLGAALLELRECASRLKLQEEHIRCSLELSCLAQCLDLAQRLAMAQQAISQLTGPIDFAAQPQSPAPRSPKTGPGLDKPVTDAALEFSMRPVNYGMYSTLALTCGFAPSTPPEAPDSAAGPTWRFAIALWSNLPADLPVAAVEAHVRDDKGHVIRVPAQPSSDSQMLGAACDDSPSSSSAVVRPESWTSFWASRSSPTMGSLRVTDVVLRIGPDAAIVWTLANFPTGVLPIGRVSAAAQQAKAPFHNLDVSLGQYELSTAVLHQAPSLQVQTYRTLMVGEHAAVSVTVNASSNCPAQQGFITASYAEGGEPPLLCNSSAPGGDTWRPGQLQLPVPALKSGTRHHMTAHLLCSRPGAVSIEARLGSEAQASQRSPTQSADASSRTEVSAAVTCIAERTFEVRASCAAATRSCAYIHASVNADSAQGPVLPAGLPCMVTVSLSSLASSNVMLQSVCLKGSSADTGVELLHCSSAVSESQPVLFRKGEVQTVVGTVLCKQPSSAVSPATLSVTWQRSRGAEVITGRSSNSDQQQAPGSSSSSELPVGPPVTTQIPLLPQHTFSPALLQVKGSWPPFITVGKPFALQLKASNATQHVLDLSVRLGDTTGFMVAGVRSGTKAVLPHSEGTLSYELVAISGGTLILPDIIVTAAQLSAQLQPLAGCKIFAAPAPKEATGAADSASHLAPKMAQLTVQ